MKRPSVDEYYLNIALAVSQRSTCLKKHYGCVIVKNGEIISTGIVIRHEGSNIIGNARKHVPVSEKQPILAAQVYTQNKTR